MIDTIFEDVKVKMAELISVDTVPENFIYLGEEKVTADSAPPKIVVTGHREDMTTGPALREATTGRVIQPFAVGTLMLHVYAFGRTYNEARILVVSFLQALAQVKVTTSAGEEVRKYNLKRSLVSISYSTWNEERSYRLAIAQVPIGDLYFVEETTWATLTEILHSCELI